MALLLEMRAQVFYSSVAGQAKDTKVQAVFAHMAEEEHAHADFIKAHIASLEKDGTFADVDTHSEAVEEVLDAKTRVEIIAAGYEAAAISAAIALEEKAVVFYTELEDRASDPEERKFYNWLANWERKHMVQLQEIDKALREEIWNDNNFWPY